MLISAARARIWRLSCVRAASPGSGTVIRFLPPATFCLPSMQFFLIAPPLSPPVTILRTPPRRCHLWWPQCRAVAENDSIAYLNDIEQADIDIYTCCWLIRHAPLSSPGFFPVSAHTRAFAYATFSKRRQLMPQDTPAHSLLPPNAHAYFNSPPAAALDICGITLSLMPSHSQNFTSRARAAAKALSFL